MTTKKQKYPKRIVIVIGYPSIDLDKCDSIQTVKDYSGEGQLICFNKQFARFINKAPKYRLVLERVK